MNSTKVYIARTTELNDDELSKELYKKVPEYRQKKIDKCRYKKDKRLSLAAGILLEKALFDFGIEQREIDFIENGKPTLSGITDFQFNLSHSGDRVMCAVSDEDVGCDVEKIKEVDLKIAKRFFYNAEYEAIMRQNSLKQSYDIFFRFWTLKESFMKVTGLGMKLPLDSFQIKIEDGNISVLQKVNSKKYYFKEFDLKDGYKYAVCGLAPSFEEPELVSLLSLLS